MKALAYVVLGGCGVVLVACSSSKKSDEEECTVDTSYNPTINAADFSSKVDNPLWPLKAGVTYIFEGGGEHDESTLTSDAKQVMGISVAVVHDVVTVGGQVTED